MQSSMKYGKSNRKRTESPKKSKLSIRDPEVIAPRPPCDSCPDDAKQGCLNKGIFDACSEPRRPLAGDNVQKEDFYNQVMASDITRPDGTQTGSSLRLRNPELPTRCGDRSRHKAGRKNWDVYAGCECPKKSQFEGEEDFALQVDARDLGACESVQTGSSLADNVPGRQDTLKCGKWPKDTDKICDCPKTVGPSVSCSENKDGCIGVRQQVMASDIQVTNGVQTGCSLTMLIRCPEYCKEGQVILFGRANRPPACRPSKVYISSEQFQPCECPGQPQPKGPSKHLSTQVKATDISPSQGVQTDKCLYLPCISAQRFQNRDWEECKVCERTPSGSMPQQDVSLQVYTLEISICDDTQTYEHDVDKCMPRKRQVCKKEGQKKELVGKARKFSADNCSKPHPQSNGPLVDNETQVKAHDIKSSSGQ